MQYKYLFDLALILLSTKVLGLFSQRFRLPHVVGALIAGLLLGPAVLGIIQATDFLKSTASLGVSVLLFTSGIETAAKPPLSSPSSACSCLWRGALPWAATSTTRSCW